MTREEAIWHIKDVICENNSIKPNIVLFKQEKEALYMAIKALKQEPCEDVISRKAVKDWFCINYCSEHNKCEHFENGDCNSMNELYSMPTVHARPKTGKWIKSKDGYHRCDQCGSRGSAIKARYCHHCGARMESEDKV